MPRYTMKDEVRSMDRGMRDDLRLNIGTTVLWYRYDPSTTVADTPYDYGLPRNYQSPFELPVLYADHKEGSVQSTDYGFYTTDRLSLVVNWYEASRHGLQDIAEDTPKYLRDRILYDGVVWRIRDAQSHGQVKDRDIVIGIDAIEVDPDELVNDPQFATYSRPAP